MGHSVLDAFVGALSSLTPWHWLLAGVAAVSVGIAKTGIPGFGTLAVPLFVLAVGDARRSAGWLLPLLCVADLFAVATYRRQAHVRRLFELAPWVLVGMGIGALALGAPERPLRLAVGGLVLAMVGLRLSRDRKQASAAPGGARAGRDPWRTSATYGLVAGVATTIANAAGPVMSLYLLSRRLPKQEFLATGAWFFFVINLAKAPIYAGHGLIDGRSLLVDAALLPAVLVGVVVGRLILRRLPQLVFERLVLALTAVAALLLFVPA